LPSAGAGRIDSFEHRGGVGGGQGRVGEKSTVTPAPALPSSIARAASDAAAGPAAVHAMTVDVEDYFQVEAFASVIDRRDWDRLPQRVERNTERLLEIFAEADIRATFFTLGWVGRRHAALARRIVAEGHELASHGLAHRRVDRQSPEAFRRDVRDSKRILEDAGGVPVRGYRAPSFSFGRETPWAHAILAEAGYRYSSSVYPGRRGGAGAPRRAFAPCPDMLEIPLSSLRIMGFGVPASGGGYFRLFPLALSRRLVAGASRANGTPTVFYLHPWEIDDSQPRQHQAPAVSRFRHYVNLGRTEARLRRLLRSLPWTRMDRLFLAEGTGPFPLIPEWLGPAPRLP
jgi:polysaccharide deacetylase family protein (PEP-CTERM system associated)